MRLLWLPDALLPERQRGSSSASTDLSLDHRDGVPEFVVPREARAIPRRAFISSSRSSTYRTYARPTGRARAHSPPHAQAQQDHGYPEARAVARPEWNGEAGQMGELGQGVAQAGIEGASPYACLKPISHCQMTSPSLKKPAVFHTWYDRRVLEALRNGLHASKPTAPAQCMHADSPGHILAAWILRPRPRAARSAGSPGRR